MTFAHVIAGRRSPVAPRNGAFADWLPHQLAAPVITDILDDCGLAPDQVDEIIVSNALGAGGNPARSVALAAGLPERVAGLTIDRQCAGGLDAISLAATMVLAGQHDIVIAGGVESYSRRPLRARTFSDGRAPEFYDQAPFTPWPDRDPDMAKAADILARNENIDQHAQDIWAINSHAKARATGAPDGAITPVAGLKTDPFARDLTLKHCAKAKSVSGTITAANMAVAADGAAFVVVTSPKIARQISRPSVRIIAAETRGGDPTLPGAAPVAAIKQVLDRAALHPSDLYSAEVMEAFAVQAIACQRGAALPAHIVNRNGGALARGHPIGASGAILAVHLFHQLKAHPAHGLAAIAAAGGIGSALLMSSAQEVSQNR